MAITKLEKTILKSLRCGARGGICTAWDYLAPIRQSFQLGRTPTSKALAGLDWQSIGRKARRSLAYCEKASAPEIIPVTTPGAIAEYETVIFTRNEDRDGDVLEPSGAVIDESMPVLWQHLPHEPCGKYIGGLVRSDNEIRCRAAIIDTPLGRDVAQFIEFGALRTSHGFRALDADPIPAGAKRPEDIKAWHVKQLEIMEISLVSVPANADAVITAFSRGKLNHPVVKGWASALYDGRTKVFGSTSIGEEQVVAVNVNVNLRGRRKSSKPKPEAETKAVKTKGFIGSIAGSWDWIRSALRESLPQFLSASGVVIGDRYIGVCCMFDDSAVVELYDYETGKQTTYQANWAKDADGVPQWVGELVEVDIEQHVVEKLAGYAAKGFRPASTKGGRVLAKRNVARLKKAIKHCKACADVLEELDKDANGVPDILEDEDEDEDEDKDEGEDESKAEGSIEPDDDGLEGEQPTQPDDDEEEEKALRALASSGIE